MADAGIRSQSLPASGSTNWYGHYSAMDQTVRTIAGAGVWLDEFTGTDDEKLTSAMSYAAAQAYPPPILLAARNHSFSTARTLYDGFALYGVPGSGNAELGSAGTMKTRATISTGATWLSASGSVRSGSQVWDVDIRDIAFTGNSSTQWMGGSAVLWVMHLSGLSFSSFKSVLGSQATKLLLNLSLIDGWMSFNNSYNGAIHIGGSDNSLFLGMTNIDSGTAYASAGSSNGQFHLWLDYMEKSTIGGFYLTAEGAWNGIKVSGPALNSGGSNLGGPNWIAGAKIEGRNAGAPCNGSLIRVEGGHLSVTDSWVGYGMASPSTPGHSPADAAIIDVLGGSFVGENLTYDHATSVAETAPYVSAASGSEVQLGKFTRGSKGGAWTGRPRVTGSGLLVTDATMTVV